MRSIFQTATTRWGSVDLISQATAPVQVMTVKEAAAHYGVSTSTIYRRARAGKLIANKNNAGRWEIRNTGATLADAAVAADLRGRLIARNALDAAPVQGPRVQPCAADDFYSAMNKRRQAAHAARRAA